MQIEKETRLDFCDVLIRPKQSNVLSRKDIELIRTFKMLHTDIQIKCLPIFGSNMFATGTFAMVKSLASFKALTALHKFYSLDDLEIFFTRYLQCNYGIYTLGVRDEDLVKLTSLTNRIGNLSLICIDAANGYTKYFVDRVKTVRKLYPNCILMAGNVATPEMVQELILKGADIIKVGIGSGSHCTTRLMTGIGYPQLSAIIECADAAHSLGGLICADGGCKTPADIAKSFCSGADFVMLGGMLSGTDECEGEWVKDGLKVYGMSSKEAQEKHYGGIPDYATSEGICSIVSKKGPVSNVMKEILGGLRSCCTYIGANSLKNMSECTTFVKVNRIK